MVDRTPITQLKGIGEKTAKLFAKLGIYTTEDLLVYFPRDYEVFKDIQTIAEAPTGSINAVIGTVCGNPTVKKVRNLTIINVLVKDSSGAMQLTFFNMPFLRNTLKLGSTFVYRGHIHAKGTIKIMEQPKIYSPAEYNGLLKYIQPRYALTKGLTNTTIQKSMKQLITFYPFEKDCYPDYMRGEYRLLAYKEAIQGIHFPLNQEQLIAARRRLVFDEFFRKRRT